MSVCQERCEAASAVWELAPAVCPPPRCFEIAQTLRSENLHHSNRSTRFAQSIRSSDVDAIFCSAAKRLARAHVHRPTTSTSSTAHHRYSTLAACSTPGPGPLARCRLAGTSTLSFASWSLLPWRVCRCRVCVRAVSALRMAVCCH